MTYALSGELGRGSSRRIGTFAALQSAPIAENGADGVWLENASTGSGRCLSYSGGVCLFLRITHHVLRFHMSPLRGLGKRLSPFYKHVAPLGLKTSFPRFLSSPLPLLLVFPFSRFPVLYLRRFVDVFLAFPIERQPPQSPLSGRLGRCPSYSGGVCLFLRITYYALRFHLSPLRG